MRLTWCAVPGSLGTLKEEQFQAEVKEAAEKLGWLVTHVRRMQGNDPGLPDLLLWRGSPERLELGLTVEAWLWELKTTRKGSKLRASQVRWAERAMAFDVDVYLFRNTEEDWDKMMIMLGGIKP